MESSNTHTQSLLEHVIYMVPRFTIYVRKNKRLGTIGKRYIGERPISLFIKEKSIHEILFHSL